MMIIIGIVKSLIIISIIAFIGAFILAFCKVGADESSESILYDNPEYFRHDEPEWLRREAEDEEQGKIQ